MFRNVPYLIDKIIVTWYNVLGVTHFNSFFKIRKVNCAKMRTFADFEHKNTGIDTIGERIRSERLRKGWTQVKFASKLGLYVNHSRISKWENGNEIPSDDIVRMMADIFECE